MRNVLLLVFVITTFVSTSSFSATVPFYSTALDSAKNQLGRLSASLGTSYNNFPRSTNAAGTVATVTYSDWTSGFFPGSLWLLFKYTGDTVWKTRARNWTNNLQSAATVNDHDVGFRILCSYGTGLEFQTAQQRKLDTAVIMRAARTLTGRYNSTIKAIKSWDTFSKNGVTYTYPVIIDNMMNLELLCWATNNSKDSSFGRIAVTHATTTKKNHFRADFSSYHVVAYDASSGAVIKKMTAQGYADESAWARGQAWGLYGYTMMYRETRDTTWLNQAMHIADYIISRLPADLVPYWDFDVPMTPTPSRDASAAAINASALIELSTFVTGTVSQAYYQKAKAILQSLASAMYTAAPNTNGNFILKHCTGHHPAGTEIDVPLNYADYYYLEALLRLKKIEETTSARLVSVEYGFTGKNNTFEVRPMGSRKVRFNLLKSSNGPATVRVCDLGGRTVIKQIVSEPATVIDLLGIPQGCYSVQVSAGMHFLGTAAVLRY
jgi:hypothetical protein